MLLTINVPLQHSEADYFPRLVLPMAAVSEHKHQLHRLEYSSQTSAEWHTGRKYERLAVTHKQLFIGHFQFHKNIKTTN